MSTRPSFAIEKQNAPRAPLSDLYYRFVGTQWRYLLLGAFVFYALVNLTFGIAYWLLRDGLRPAGLGFADCYFFSVHTFSTVGYGSMSPASLAVNWITVLETFCGLVSMALLTGLCFAKFSRPVARFLFTRHLLVTQYRGKRALVARVGNARANTVMNAEMSLTVMFDEITPEGVKYRRLEDLPLERDHTPVFILSLTVAHIIEPGSRAEKMLECLSRRELDVEFLLSVRGVDETLGQTIHDMYVFGAESVVFDRQFADVLTENGRGAVVIDFGKFQDLR